MSKKAILTILKTVLPLLLGAYLFWIFFTSMSKTDKELFVKALYEANYFWIIIALILGVIAYFSRAYRWKYVLEPLGFKTKFWNRYHAIMIGYIINLTIPRAGEASRSAMLYRSEGVPFSSSFGTIIAERAIDLVVLVSIACLTAFLGYDDFLEIKAQIISLTEPVKGGFPWKKVIYGFILLIGLVFTYFFFFKRKFRQKFLNFIKDVISGLFSIFRSKQPFSYILHTIVIWVCYIAMFALPFQAFHETESISFSGVLLGFIAGSLGIVLTNGGFGSYPILVGLVVAFYIEKDYPSDAQSIGKALGIIIWVSQTILMIILGLISLYLLPKNFSKENEQVTVSGE